MLTFVFIHAVVTVLFSVTPPGQWNALTAVSTLPLVFSACCLWWHAVLDRNNKDSTTALPMALKKALHKAPENDKRLRNKENVVLYLLVWPVFAVILTIAEPFFLQALVTVWASELDRTARRSRAIHLIRAITAVSVSVTSQSLRNTLTAKTAELVYRTGH